MCSIEQIGISPNDLNSVDQNGRVTIHRFRFSVEEFSLIFTFRQQYRTSVQRHWQKFWTFCWNSKVSMSTRLTETEIHRYILQPRPVNVYFWFFLTFQQQNDFHRIFRTIGYDQHADHSESEFKNWCQKCIWNNAANEGRHTGPNRLCQTVNASK